MTLLVNIPVTQLKGVRTVMAEKLAKVGIENLQDVLFHLPSRYQDRTKVTPIAAVKPGQDAVILGTVMAANIVMGRRRSLLVRIQDATGSISLRFFHFSVAQKNALQQGTLIRCYGEARAGATGLEIYHPEYRAQSAEQPITLDDSLTAIYPTTEGLTQQRLRSLAEQALAFLSPLSLPEWLPTSILDSYQLGPLEQAVRYLHQPPPDAATEQLLNGTHWAQQRLAFEELLTHQLSMQRMRNVLQAQQAPMLAAANSLPAQFLANLGFKTTHAQQRVGEEITWDLQHTKPTLRLLQGDVGAGKTLVAALAALQAIEAGYQVALMAPTEILAEQHYLNFKKWFNPLNIEVAWLAGKLKGKVRAQALEQIEQGAPMVLVTHALFQNEVQFAH